MKMKPNRHVIKIISGAVGVLLLLMVVAFIGIQFIAVDQSNPPVLHEPAWDSPQTQALMDRACYDCHSNQTAWPWYSNVAPASWLVARHVHEGRAALNFSEWGLSKGQGETEAEEDEAREKAEGRESETEEIIEEISEGGMPPKSYLLLHPGARLSDTEMATLISGLKATFGPGAEGALKGN